MANLQTFDPQTWLASFENVGGCWIVRDCLSLAIQVENRSDEDQIAARLMIAELTPERRSELTIYLASRTPMEATDG